MSGMRLGRVITKLVFCFPLFCFVLDWCRGEFSDDTAREDLRSVHWAAPAFEPRGGYYLLLNSPQEALASMGQVRSSGSNRSKGMIRDAAPPPLPVEGRQVGAIPTPPEELNAETLDTWVKAAVENTTTILILWQGKNVYKSAELFSPTELTQEMVDSIPSQVVDALEGSLDPREFPEDFDGDAVMGLVKEQLRLGDRHLRAIGQAQIYGVPQSVAQQVAESIMESYPEQVKHAEVDVIVTLHPPLDQNPIPVGNSIMEEGVGISSGPREVGGGEERFGSVGEVSSITADMQASGRRKGPAAGFVPLLE